MHDDFFCTYILDLFMTKKRGNNGRYISSCSEKRDSNLTIRMSKSNKDKLKKIAKDTGSTNADVINNLIENNAGNNLDDLEKIGESVLSKFKQEKEIDEQSTDYANGKKLLNMFINALKNRS